MLVRKLKLKWMAHKPRNMATSNRAIRDSNNGFVKGFVCNLGIVPSCRLNSWFYGLGSSFWMNRVQDIFGIPVDIDSNIFVQDIFSW